jgi:hypothetical protein
MSSIGVKTLVLLKSVMHKLRRGCQKVLSVVAFIARLGLIDRLGRVSIAACSTALLTTGALAGKILACCASLSTPCTTGLVLTAFQLGKGTCVAASTQLDGWCLGNRGNTGAG